MIISGLYVETVPGKAEDAAKELGKMKGVEIHHIEKNHKIVLTIEADTVDQSYKISDSFKLIPSILLVCLVYNHLEEEPNYLEAVISQ
ncbi:MAG: chaperone NapD [Bacillota bacterium]